MPDDVQGSGVPMVDDWLDQPQLVGAILKGRDIQFRRILGEMLSRDGFDVVTAQSMGPPIARASGVAKYRGSLTFESEVGKGTTFRILLPIYDGPASTGGT